MWNGIDELTEIHSLDDMLHNLLNRMLLSDVMQKELKEFRARMQRQDRVAIQREQGKRDLK